MKVTKVKAGEFLKNNLLKIGTGFVILIILSLILGASFQTLLMTFIFIVLGSFSTFYFNWVRAPINFELVKLSTILMAYTQGIVPGLIVGILATIIGKVLIGRIDEKLPISVVAISIVALGASVFTSVSIVTLGIILVGVYNLAQIAVSFALGGDPGWILPYEGTNFVINFILFTRFAPILVTVL